jgi:DNA polymerase-3 subunit gamma/tau
MTAQALYLKYRPQTFEDVVGQEPITRTLQNALRHAKFRQAYLFTGPRGTGKTTTARLLAKAVNCQAVASERPCNKCPICVAINEGRLLDLIEIDAASNRGIDEIRDIREKVGFRPSEGQYKVYVLDEAHMLTEPAFNALLKTLEEPPPHVIFALVTTDPHKIPATITSRCQRFDFGRIPVQAIVDRLAYIAGQEGIIVEQQALEFIAHHSTGAMRDAISLLDQLASYGAEITLDKTKLVMGTVASEAAAKLAAKVVDADLPGGLDLINRAVGDGADPRQFGREVVEYLRGILLLREGAGARLLSATEEQAAEMDALAQRVSSERLLRALRLFNEAVTDLRHGLQTIPQLPLEMALMDSVLDPDAPPLSAGIVRNGAVLYQTSQLSRDPHAQQAAMPQPQATTTQASQQEVASPASVASPVEPPQAQQEQVATLDAPEVEAPVQAFSLPQVEQAWPMVLHAVRQRNPATEGALRSQCEPVEVRNDEVVITFPFPFLREKLVDPGRKGEIQDALSEVLKAKCRVKLVLASEYVPGKAPNPTPAPPAAFQKAEPNSADQAEGEKLDADEVAQELTRWAEERGGQVTIVPPENA